MHFSNGGFFRKVTLVTLTYCLHVWDSTVYDMYENTAISSTYSPIHVNPHGQVTHKDTWTTQDKTTVLCWCFRTWCSLHWNSVTVHLTSACHICTSHWCAHAPAHTQCFKQQKDSVTQVKGEWQGESETKSPISTSEARFRGAQLYCLFYCLSYFFSTFLSSLPFPHCENYRCSLVSRENIDFLSHSKDKKREITLVGRTLSVSLNVCVLDHWDWTRDTNKNVYATVTITKNIMPLHLCWLLEFCFYYCAKNKNFLI